MTANAAPKQPRRGKGKPFAPGTSGNPGGKAPGTRHRATVMAEALIEADATDIVRAVITAAKGGDPSAMRLCLERLAPVRKGRPIEFTLPQIKTAGDVTAALGAVVAQMAGGTISPEEAGQVAAVLEIKRKAIETSEIEARLATIEVELGKQRA